MSDLFKKLVVLLYGPSIPCYPRIKRVSGNKPYQILIKACGDETTENDMWLHSGSSLRPPHAQKKPHARQEICQPAVTLILILR